MAGNGPAPKPDAQRRRRNATVAMTKLPAAGRRGRPPAWPLPANVRLTTMLELARADQADVEERIAAGDEKIAPLRAKLARIRERVAVLEATLKASTKLEAELWRDLWRTPQAVQWEKLGWNRTVAQYVRWKAQAELGDLDAGKESRQYEDRLGLSSLAMLRLRWEVVEDEVTAHRNARAAAASTTSTGRRLAPVRVIDSAT